MYVVTFYSYKGGVGRTMALVNTSVALGRSGRRVLVVDFDLEAPGLPSYSVFQQANCGAGIVDYVTAYRTTGIAPKASEYITSCDVDGTRIWLMPAGRHTQPGYTEALNSIDWQDLYEHQEGYLMFEDLKQQWAQFEGKGFDYVLIDSRTGHTDVGGICTRQLPDAVVIMFMPNEQNIDGLVPIVNGIRSERQRRKKIALEFCPSNVPDLDDEKEILSSLLARAKEKLGYKRDPAATLHHYGSLDILAQQAFVLSRPNSNLSKEYEKLRASIVALNYDDAEGALVALQRMPADYERGRTLSRASIRERIRARAIDIRSRHPGNGEVAYLAARVFSEIGDPAEEIAALTVAIDVGHELNRARLARAYTFSSVNRRDEALGDLREIVASPTGTIFELAPALQLLQEIDPDWTQALARALERPDSEVGTLNALGPLALSVREGLPLAAARMEKVLRAEGLSSRQAREAKNITVLALIGSGEFTHAKRVINPDSSIPAESLDLIDLFNFAVADWGERGAPSQDLFDLALRGFRQDQGRGTNFHQCFALASVAAGDLETAQRETALALGSVQAGDFEFSCWRYLYADADEMLEDLEAMQKAIDAGHAVVPSFFGEIAGLTKIK